MDELRVEYMRLSEVEAAFDPSNPRRHDVKGVSGNIAKRGFVAPPLLNEATGKLSLGHGRTKALRHLCESDPDDVPRRIERAEDGEWMLPVIRGLSFKSKAEAEEYLVADNRWAEAGGWDPEATAKILERIRKRGALEGTGYTEKQVDRLLYEVRKPRTLRDPEAPPAPKDPVTKTGDVIRLGPHVLVCGDSRIADTVQRALVGERADMVWTDPPYGVEYESRGRKTPHDPIANDGRDPGDLLKLLRAAFGSCVSSSKPGAPVYCAAPPGPHSTTFGVVLGELGIHRQTLIWMKDQLVLGRSHFHYRHEFLFYGWLPGAACLHAPPTRKEDTVWAFPRPKVSEEHPTMKPVALVGKAIELSSAKGALVLDPFGGSGTTLLAAEQLGRRAALVELSPAYCDVIVARWEKLTGKRAVRD